MPQKKDEETQVREALEEMNQEIYAAEGELKKIQSMQGSLIEKWQHFIGIILPIQMGVAHERGYGEGQPGLSNFNAELLRFSQDNAELRRLNREKWDFLFRVAFGMTTHQTASLEETKKIVTEITEAMTSSEFLKKVEALAEEYPDTESDEERRKQVLTILLPLHMSVLEKYGFKGEEGYIAAQGALMDHYFSFDDEIRRKINDAQEEVFHHAGLV